MQNGLKSKFFLLLLLFGVLPAIVSAWELKPVNSMQLYPEPDTDARLIFSADTPAESDFLPYDLLNYAGEKVFSGKLLRNKDNRWELTFNRPAGFYEIELENGQRIGVLAAPTAKKPYDDFFAHEALFGGESPSYIRDHIAVFRKFGLLNVREYCGWQDMAQHGNYSGQRAILDTLHDGGLRSMIFFDRLPAVANVGGKSNLPRYMHKLSDEADRLLDCSSNADYIQVYNEFVNRLGDASVPATVLFGNRIREKHSQAVLIGQGMCAAQQSVSAVSSFVQNGYHELTEALCIQTYAAPEAIEAIIRDYREALKGDDRQGMDLWCTESGKPWYRGGVSATLKGKVSAEKRRADILEDQISAKWIAMKAVEFKALGAKRYFPFTQKPHVENANNFGMIDFLHTPMRSQAAYLVLPGVIGGMKYIGDLRFPASENITLCRVFSGKDRTVAVLYRNDNDTAPVSLRGLPVTGILSVDGARIPVASDKVKMTGGILYLELDGQKLGGSLVTDTEAMRLFAMSEHGQAHSRKVYPGVLLYDYQPERDGTCDPAGYNFLPRRIDVVAMNFSPEEIEIKPETILPHGAKVVESPSDLIKIPANGEVAVSWEIDWKGCNESNPVFKVQDGNGNTPPLSLRFFYPEKCASKTFDFMNLDRWTRNCNGDMSIQYDPPENALRFHVNFLGHTDRWVFPRYTLSDSETFDDVVALEFKIKAIQSPREKRYAFNIVFIGDNRLGYEPPTEEWETRTVMLKGAIQDNARSMMIGMGAYSPEMVFWIKDIRFLKSVK